MDHVGFLSSVCIGIESTNQKLHRVARGVVKCSNLADRASKLPPRQRLRSDDIRQITLGRLQQARASYMGNRRAVNSENEQHHRDTWALSIASAFARLWEWDPA